MLCATPQPNPGPTPEASNRSTTQSTTLAGHHIHQHDAPTRRSTGTLSPRVCKALPRPGNHRMGPDIHGTNSTVMVASTNPPLQTDKRHALLRQGNTYFMEIYFGSLDRTQPNLHDQDKTYDQTKLQQVVEQIFHDAAQHPATMALIEQQTPENILTKPLKTIRQWAERSQFHMRAQAKALTLQAKLKTRDIRSFFQSKPRHTGPNSSDKNLLRPP